MGISQWIGACLPCAKPRKFDQDARDRQSLLKANHSSASVGPSATIEPKFYRHSPPPPPPPPPRERQLGRHSSPPCFLSSGDQCGQDHDSISFDASICFPLLFGRLTNPPQMLAVWNETFHRSLVYLKASDAMTLGDEIFGSVSGWHYTTAVHALCMTELVKRRAVSKPDGVEEKDQELLQNTIDICRQGILEAEEREGEGFYEEGYMDSPRPFNRLTYKAALLEGKEAKAVWNNDVLGCGILRFRGWGKFMLGEQLLGLNEDEDFIEREVVSQAVTIFPVENCHGKEEPNLTLF